MTEYFFPGPYREKNISLQFFFRSSSTMSKYECCGVMYDDSEKLTSHMRKDHSVSQFDVALACCGTTFASSKKLSEHMKGTHRIDMSLEI